jgi:hypothetical protein
MNTTAEQWVNQQFEKQRITTNGNDDVYCSRQGIIDACQIFAKLHVEAALKAARDDFYNNKNKNWIGEDILNSYPLSNLIK